MRPDDVKRAKKLVEWAKPWHRYEPKPHDGDEPSMGRLIQELGEKLWAALESREELEAENSELKRQRDLATSEALRAHEEAGRAEAAERVLDAQCRQAGALLREVLAAIPADLLERFAVGRSEVPSLPEVFGDQRILRADELRRRILARLAR